MTVQQLPRTLASLVHHVELSQAGWRDRALELILVGVISESGGVCGRDELSTLLNAKLPVALARSQVDRILGRLKSKGTILSPADDRLKLSEAATAELLELSADHDRLETSVQSKFSALIASLSPAPFDWRTFHTRLLTPLLLELGARSYEFLSGQISSFGRTESFLAFLNSLPAESRVEGGRVIEAFFNPRDPDIRSYILRFLNASFLVLATGIPESSMDPLTERTKRRLRLRVIVDTNFLFSLIGLHENPADDVVEVLNRLISQLHDRLDVRMYILPSTLDEAKGTIEAYASRLSGIHIDRNLAEAVRSGTTDLSGITLKFIKEAVSARKGLNAKDYFQPYLDDLVTIARSKGVELYNEPIDHLRLDQGVIDDVLSQMEFEKRTKRPENAKSYELLLHDMVLWHFVHRKRPVRFDSYLDAEFWAATIDFGLLGFDRYRVRKESPAIPVCVHPTVLLQVLQLWIPRNDLLDAALVDSLRPLLPHVFDRDAERVTIRILRVLSRFEDVGDLTSETLTHVLFDKAVRARVGATDEIEQQILLVREALVAETSRLELKTKDLGLEAAGLRAEVQKRDDLLVDLRGQVATIRETSGRQTQNLEEQLRAERTTSKSLSDRLAALEAARDLEISRRVRRVAWLQLLGAALATAGFFCGAAWFLVHSGVLPVLYPMWVSSTLVWAFAIGATLLGTEGWTRLFPVLGNEPLVLWLTRTRRFWLTIIGTLAGGVLGSAIWDAVRAPGP